LEGYRADLVHAHGLWTYLSAAALREHRRTGTPVVISPHGMLDPWALAFSRLRKRIAAGLFQNSLLRSAAVLHALTLAEARSIRAYGLPNPVVVIPNGVVLPTGEPGGPPWGVSEAGRDRVLLFLSRIHPKKGLDLLIEQWADFSRRGQAGERWRLVVAGWDEIGHEGELRKMVEAWGLGESVDFVGPLFGAGKAAALAHADAFVLPSRSEGLPVAVLEAWAHGKPVVMSKACNLPEGTASGAAIEVDQEPGSLASGLARLAALGDTGRGAMGAAGRRLVEERFCWTRIAEDMASVYRAVVNGAPIPAALIYPETS
jgi:poly(glycerol-phosphate) alpha-glucosyltransferase